MKDLTELGERLTTLSTGAKGVRGELRCEVKAAPGDGAELDFIATDETLDRYGEIVKLDGWELANYRANPVVLDSHNYWSVASILGRSQEVLITEGKMRNRVKFAMDNPLGAIAYKMAKAGFIKSESVGFIPLEWKNGVGPNEPRRTYLKSELLEISLVSVPANPGATIENALKSGAVGRGDVKELYAFLKQFLPESGSPKADAPVDSRARAGALDVAQAASLAREISMLLVRT
jgi:HK97 family phage prohead protease